MKAVILAAGKGTRMRELTDECPKPMLRVQGKPILEHILEGLKSAGISDAFIVTGHKAEMVEGYFADGGRIGLRIAYGRQTVQNGTGKAPEVAREFVGDSPFLLTYGDILVYPQTYRMMLERFGQANFAGLVTVTAGQDVTKGAIVRLDSEFCFVDLIEKPTTAQLEDLRGRGLLGEGIPLWYNAGIYIFKPEVFEFTAKLTPSPRGEYELTDAILGLARAGHRLAALEVQGRWIDVRDPEVLAELEGQGNRLAGQDRQGTGAHATKRGS